MIAASLVQTLTLGPVALVFWFVGVGGVFACAFARVPAAFAADEGEGVE